MNKTIIVEGKFIYGLSFLKFCLNCLGSNSEKNGSFLDFVHKRLGGGRVVVPNRRKEICTFVLVLFAPKTRFKGLKPISKTIYEVFFLAVQMLKFQDDFPLLQAPVADLRGVSGELLPQPPGGE